MEEFVNGNIFFSKWILFEGAILVPWNYLIPLLPPLPALLAFMKLVWITLQLGMGAVNKNGCYDEIEELWYGQKTPWDYNLSWAHLLILEKISF